MHLDDTLRLFTFKIMALRSNFPLFHTNFIVVAGVFVMHVSLLKPSGHVMHQQFNIQQLYALPHTIFMCFVFI